MSFGTRHEEYNTFQNGLPFVLNSNIVKTKYNLSDEMNWHENIEIQLCTDGEGQVLLDGEEHLFQKDDIIAVNSNVIHYTGAYKYLTYSCIIISSQFCKQMDIDYDCLCFTPVIHNSKIKNMFLELIEIYNRQTEKCRTAILNSLVLNIIIELTVHYSTKNKKSSMNNRILERVKTAICYMRTNYKEKLTLEKIAKAVYIDKYTLSHDFKKYTGQTIVQYLNILRCQKAAEMISSGHTIYYSAYNCGFDNISYFTKVFRKNMGMLPSKIKDKSKN